MKPLFFQVDMRKVWLTGSNLRNQVVKLTMSQGAQLDESAEQTEIKQCAEKFELSRLTCALSYQDLHVMIMTWQRTWTLLFSPCSLSNITTCAVLRDPLFRKFRCGQALQPPLLEWPLLRPAATVIMNSDVPSWLISASRTRVQLVLTTKIPAMVAVDIFPSNDLISSASNDSRFTRFWTGSRSSRSSIFNCPILNTIAGASIGQTGAAGTPGRRCASSYNVISSSKSAWAWSAGASGGSTTPAWDGAGPSSSGLSSPCSSRSGAIEGEYSSASSFLFCRGAGEGKPSAGSASKAKESSGSLSSASAASSICTFGSPGKYVMPSRDENRFHIFLPLAWVHNARQYTVVWKFIAKKLGQLPKHIHIVAVQHSILCIDTPSLARPASIESDTRRTNSTTAPPTATAFGLGSFRFGFGFRFCFGFCTFATFALVLLLTIHQSPARRWSYVLCNGFLHFFEIFSFI